MKLRVVGEEIAVSWPMWAVSVSSPPRVNAMFADEWEARKYAREMERTFQNVRLFQVTFDDPVVR